MPLRPYQEEGLARIESAFEQARLVLAVGPTAMGKTQIFTEYTKRQRQPGLILVHRHELIDQASNRFRENGIDFGVIAAGYKPRPSAQVQIASVMSLVKREFPPARFIVNDEAHLSTAKTWRTLLASYPDAKILGVTASPWRLSGMPLGELYDATVTVSNSVELRELGFLAPYVGFSYEHPDLAKLKTRAGEYTDESVSEAMNKSVITDNIVEMYCERARGLSAILFAANVAHSKSLAERFRSVGISAEHLDGSTPQLARKRIIREFNAGAIMVLCNVGVAVEGLDVPRAKCCILGRPTKSLSRYIQSVGRIMRPWEGVVARIHDHAFCVGLHGLPDDPREPDGKPTVEADGLGVFQCKKCFAVYRRGPCKNCPRELILSSVADLPLVKPTQEVEFTSAGLPTIVRWETPGREITGVFEGANKERGTYGPTWFYLIRGATRRYKLPGTSELDRKMREVRIGELTSVLYEGKKPLHTKEGFYHAFRVEVRETNSVGDPSLIWEPPADPVVETEHGSSEIW